MRNIDGEMCLNICIASNDVGIKFVGLNLRYFGVPLGWHFYFRMKIEYKSEKKIWKFRKTFFLKSIASAMQYELRTSEFLLKFHWKKYCIEYTKNEYLFWSGKALKIDFFLIVYLDWENSWNNRNKRFLISTHEIRKKNYSIEWINFSTLFDHFTQFHSFLLSIIHQMYSIWFRIV